MLRRELLLTYLVLASVVWAGLLLPGNSSRPAATDRATGAERAPSPAPAGFPDITLPNWEAKPVALSAVRGERATALMFVSTECPISNGYVPTFNRIARDYGERGIALVAVNSNDGQSLRDLAGHRKEFQLECDVLKDAGGRLAQRLGVKTAPTAVVLGPDGEVLYFGRIDDRYSRRGGAANEVRHHDLVAALDAIVAGQPVPVGKTEPLGCPIVVGRVTKTDEKSPAGTPTYSLEISRILQQNCGECHRDGGVGPFALASYDDAVSWADDLRTFTQDRTMPPWLPVDGYGDFHNRRAMSDADIEQIARWVNAGCPQGNPADLPPVRERRSGWVLGEPDIVLAPSEEFQLSADGADVYRCFVLPTDFPEDVYVDALEVIPGNARVVHHVIAFLDTGNASSKLDAKDPGPGYSTTAGYPGFLPAGGLGGWAPGNTANRLPAGMAKVLPKGAKVVMQVHYHKSGKPETDLTRLGIYLKQGEVTRAVRALPVMPFGGPWSGMRIPAGDDNYEVRASVVVPRDVLALKVTPHMHLLGKDMQVIATRPDGTTEPLIYVKHWDFNWQEGYQYREPVPLPAGTRLDLVAHFDNSESNPHNPSSPPKTVRWGEQTTSEMCIAFLEVAPMEEVSSASDLKAPAAGELLREALEQKLQDAIRRRPRKSSTSRPAGP